MSFKYPPIVTGSNFNPIAIRVRREGVLLEALGVTVTVTVKNRETNEIVCTDAVATFYEAGIWQYRFTPEQVALIVANSEWYVQWKVVASTFTWRSEPLVLPVHVAI
jgi:hypothetical protein